MRLAPLCCYATDPDTRPECDDRSERAVGPGVRVGGVAAQRCQPHVNSWLTADRCALRSGGSRDHSVLLPGAGLVIALVAAQAAVQDADEPVAQGTQRLVMGGSPSPAGVVVGAGAG